MVFIETNHRNPSKHYPGERNMHSWIKHSKKLQKTGKLKPNRTDLFNKLLLMYEQHKHVNQYL